ncbi:phosphatase PAP2 family protein [Natronolimnohabitans innermongolicus]|uniref:PA-phosphatase-like phosphoesterase n=1 Tax=Natronolimnohabitans innermongolicus JCM 12255 TaxID=1227499 RepID=L9XAR7_9EURY|nr:phosphatase PAP2 family protein [Natronolimnohabitans innermongolicus]ELY57713.1 PA-phosphatase-like phosphoesterase [Natronolimnohabitans innermongolicus JCM 12255]
MWFDPAIVEAVRDAVPTWLGVILVLLSYLGSVYLIAPGLIAAYWANRDLAAPWIGGIVGCYGMMSITKSYHSGTRPTVEPPVSSADFPSALVPLYEHAAHISTASFPSGHALAATIIVGLLVVDLPVSTFPKRFVAGLAAVGWVGFTRVGLGVHYHGDVAGGIAYGLAFLAVYYLARRILTRRTSLDAAGAAFAVGLVVGLVAAAYVGSRNSYIVLGGAIGGLFAWHYAPTIARRMRGTVWERLAPVAGLAVVLVTWYVAEMELGTYALMVPLAAFLVAAVVLVPWIAPTGDLWTSAKRRGWKHGS